MKRRKRKPSIGVTIWTKVNGRLKREHWVPCRAFAAAIGRPYPTVIDWMRAKWIPAMEIGMGRYYVCITPLSRAKAAYRRLLKSGRLRKPRHSLP